MVKTSFGLLNKIRAGHSAEIEIIKEIFEKTQNVEKLQRFSQNSNFSKTTFTVDERRTVSVHAR
jgi:hypothetical protein